MSNENINKMKSNIGHVFARNKWTPKPNIILRNHTVNSTPFLFKISSS
jgi:hypothetical protein